MLPGVGIFGSDPISKVLIQLLKHFGFEIHAIWTNNENDLIDINNNNSSSSNNEYGNLLTNSIDNVLLNKNVNLVFVCCQPSLHSQICSKALGIGKNVICCFPTCKEEQDIQQMLNSAYYYPTLMSSINYGGLRYLTEYKLMKDSIKLIGDIKLCNITINCKNINSINQITTTLTTKNKNGINDLFINNTNNNNSNNNNNNNTSLTNTNEKAAIINNNNNIKQQSLNYNDRIKAHKLCTKLYTHWHADKDLGAGILNRYGSAIVSLILYLFDDKKISKVNGCVKTIIENINYENFSTKNNNKTSCDIIGNGTSTSGSIGTNTNTNDDDFMIKIKTKQITADDYCNFQLNLEPNAILVNVTINSVVQCKYEQEIVICGTNGTLLLNNLNSKLILRPTHTTTIIEQNNTNLIPNSSNSKQQETNYFDHIDLKNRIDEGNRDDDNVHDDGDDADAIELLNSYKSIEDYHPELPYLYIKGLYSYIKLIKEKFTNNQNLNENIDNFEHTRIVQLIIQNIYESSLINKWISVHY